MKTYNRRKLTTLIGAFLLIFSMLGLNSNGITLFYKSVTEDLGFSMSSFSLYYSLCSLAGMCSVAFVGRFLTRRFKHIRLIVIVACAVNGLGIMLYFGCTKLWQFYLISIIRGLIAQPVVQMPATMLVNNWFVKKRGLMISIVYTGSSFGGIFYTQLSNYFITHFGWRLAYVSLGISCLLFMAAIVLLIHPGPQYMKDEEFMRLFMQEQAENTPPETRVGGGVMLGQVVRTGKFWLFIVASCAGCLASISVTQYLTSSLMLDHGYSSTFAANIYTVLMASAVAGKLIYGVVIDKFGMRKSLVYNGLMLLSALLCILFSGVRVLAVAGAVLFGMGNMAATVTLPNFITDTFGLKDYGSIYGFVYMFVSACGAISTFVFAFLYDLSGGYTLGWVVIICLNLVHTLGFLTAGMLIRKVRPQLEAEAEAAEKTAV